MAAWSSADLDRIGSSEELDLASRRADRTLSGFVTMWVVRVGDDLYVRSAGGADRPWYRHAVARGVGTVRAGGIELDVAFAEADAAVQTSVDDAYHAKYDRYGPKIVGSVAGPAAHPVTIRLTPTTTSKDT